MYDISEIIISIYVCVCVLGGRYVDHMNPYFRVGLQIFSFFICANRNK